MQIHQLASIDKREPTDALVIPLFKGESESYDLGRLTEIIRGPKACGDFVGRVGEVVAVWGNEPEEKRLFMLGLGEKESCSLEGLRRSFGALAKSALKYKCKTLNILVPVLDHLPVDTVVKALVEGLYLAGYVFDALKNETVKDDPTVRLEEITLIGPDLHAMAKAAERAKKVMTAVWQARDLVNGNADDIKPEFLAEFAKNLSQEFGRIRTEVKDRAWIEKENMGLLLAVSRGSAVEPRFIISSYRGDPTSNDHTVLVGKGITYDTGGLNLKTPEGMLSMRSDMSGAAVCLATIQAIGALGLAVNVTAVVPTCENAISALSYKLGDVYKSRSGLTVEITNTDAEGRLILADAISYAVDILKPSRLIDVGTLTGSIEIALGNELMGLFSNSDALAEELWHSGQRTFERTWKMPLYEEYKEQLKSDIADIKNAATRKGGAILCAIFLQQFVKNLPWAHLDIAPVAFYKDPLRYWPKNATGIGVRLLVDYLEHHAKNIGN